MTFSKIGVDIKKGRWHFAKLSSISNKNLNMKGLDGRNRSMKADNPKSSTFRKNRKDDQK